jgi:hypothetical protein
MDQIGMFIVIAGLAIAGLSLFIGEKKDDE